MMSKAKRAKNSILPKIFLIILLVIGIAYGVINYKPEIERGIASITSTINGTSIKSYNSNDFVNDYVKAIFTDSNGTRYIPIVYANHEKQITSSDIKSKFAEYGIEITKIPDRIVNGSTVETEKATYKVLIYGDVNSDGKINVLDAQRIVLHIINNGTGKNALTGISKIAANVWDVNKDVINVRDAQKIVDFILSREMIMGDLPASDISKDTEAPVITVTPDENGNVDLIIIKGRNYNELGATVKDDMDPNVKVVTTYSKHIDTNVVDTYEVFYTARDISGKTSTEKRIVKVEEENTPQVIIADGKYKDGDTVYVNVASDVDDGAIAYYNSLGLENAYAVDEKAGNLNVTVTGLLDEEQLKTPGLYEVEYVSKPNAQNRVGRAKIYVRVLNRVTRIALTPSTNAYEFDEGETITFNEELKARIYWIDDTFVDVPVTSFGKGDYKDFSLEISDNGNKLEDRKAVYYDYDNTPKDRNDGGRNSGRKLTGVVNWVSSAPLLDTNGTFKELKVQSSSDDIGIMTVIGNIREVFDDESGILPDKQGEMYDVLEIARITTKYYQQNLSSENLKASDIEVKILDEHNTPIKTEEGTANVLVDFVPDTNVPASITKEQTKAVIKFWATKPGTYNIKLNIKCGDTVITREVNGIKVTELTKVTSVEPRINSGKLYDGILKVNGNTKQCDVDFRYWEENNIVGTVNKFVNVKKERVTVTFANNDGTKAELITDSNNYVTGVKITPPKTAVISGDYITNTMTVFVDKPDVPTENDKSISVAMPIKIYPESIYSVVFENDTEYVEDNIITLYLKNVEDTRVINGQVYTLVPISLIDQYSVLDETDPLYDRSEKAITADMITTTNDLSDYGKIAIVSDATVKYTGEFEIDSFINAIGFKADKTRASGKDEVEYLGIALNDKGLGDEDDRIEKDPIINAFCVSKDTAGNDVTQNTMLTVSGFVKKPVTTLSITAEKSNDYCYENSVVANVKSGPWEEDLTVNNVSLAVSGPASNCASKEQKQITIDTDNGNGESVQTKKPDGTINIRLNAPYSGDYTITAGYSGNNNVIPVAQTVKITENPIVTSVAFSYKEKYKDRAGNIVETNAIKTEASKNGGVTQFGGVYNSNDITKNGTVRQSKTELHQILYYHDYNTGNGIETRLLTEDIMPVMGNVHISEEIKYGNTTYPAGTNSLVVSKTYNGKNISTGSSGVATTVDGIAVRYSNGDFIDKHLTFDITIDQSDLGADNFTCTVGVNTIRQANIEGVVLKSLNSSGTYNLYSDIDTNNVVQTYGTSTKEMNNGDMIYTYNKINYTVFKLYHVDEDYDEVPVQATNFSTYATSGTHTVYILDDNARAGMPQVAIMTLDRNTISQEFTAGRSSDVEYVGIGLRAGRAVPNELGVYLNSTLKQRITTEKNELFIISSASNASSFTTDNIVKVNKALSNNDKTINKEPIQKDEKEGETTTGEDNQIDKNEVNSSTSNIIDNNEAPVIPSNDVQTTIKEDDKKETLTDGNTNGIQTSGGSASGNGEDENIDE